MRACCWLAAILLGCGSSDDGVRRGDGWDGGPAGGSLDAGRAPADTRQPCPPGPLFTVAPVDLEQVVSVSGPGSFGAPGHVVPTDHGGVSVRDAGVEFRAPGPFTIRSLRRVTYIASLWRQGERDYAISYSACGGEAGTFGHVASLTDVLDALVADGSCSSYSTEAETVESCETRPPPLDVKVAAGDVLGTVGGATSRGFDWGHLDEGVTKFFVNPSRYGRIVHATCPYDRFEPTLRDELTARMARTIEPRCGTVQIDVADTAQGVWVDRTNPVSLQGDESPFATLGPDYTRDGMLHLALGPPGVGGRSRVMAEETAGRKNRAPSAVGPDGRIHCYVEQWADATESHLLALEPSGELRIEMVSHAAGASPCDADPSTWAFGQAAMTFIR